MRQCKDDPSSSTLFLVAQTDVKGLIPKVSCLAQRNMAAVRPKLLLLLIRSALSILELGRTPPGSWQNLM